MLGFISSSKFIVMVVLVLLWVAESYHPAARGRQQRLRHALRNLTLGGVNALLSATLTVFLLMLVSEAAATTQFGLLYWLPASWPTTIFAVILLDAWMYIWHRANHALPFLWRFHCVHHCDAEMDVTSAVRFHAGEILLSGLVRLLVVALLGLSLQQVLLYDAILLPVIFFHHSNIYLPERIDQILRVVLTTPALHRVHHSRLQSENDSNYGSIFSWWDRGLNTFCLRRDGTPIDFGLDGYDSSNQQSIIGQSIIELLQMPFRDASSATRVWSSVSPVPVKPPRLQ